MNRNLSNSVKFGNENERAWFCGGNYSSRDLAGKSGPDPKLYRFNGWILDPKESEPAMGNMGNLYREHLHVKSYHQYILRERSPLLFSVTFIFRILKILLYLQKKKMPLKFKLDKNQQLCPKLGKLQNKIKNVCSLYFGYNTSLDSMSCMFCVCQNTCRE